MIEVTQHNLTEVIEQNAFLVLDFWAEWCAPCKVLAETIKNIAPNYPDVAFASVNIDIEKELAEEFSIRSIPAVMILREQVVVFAQSGAMSASELKGLLDQARALDKAELERLKSQ